ncbi:MAG: glycosyltransferase [Lunatimonas sp.]|uniref:glycosyltransferase n=1 Tax=Lunatimonas sp. TaxID=2060141 RepID=UPI00263ABAF4|nr:glycosyltransferase [Lunatimonas sp.]MCC5938280.1 glycosyltransferase [Lunatimonas sp.]
MEEVVWMVFFFAVTVQLMYMLFIFGRLAFFHKRSSKDLMLDAQEGVTILVAARNELVNLQKQLPVLLDQNYPRFEILYVNDRSVDDTEDWLREQEAQHPNLRSVHVRYTPDHVTAKKYALTLGIKVAAYDVILLTDADCIPVSDQWIRRMTAPVRNQHKTFALGHGAYLEVPGFLNKLIQFETLLTALYYFSFGLWRAPFMGVGRNLCYRKSFFLENKAFHGLWHIVGGDDDLFVNKHADKTNTSVVIHPESVTMSQPKATFGEFFTQKRRHFQAGKYYRLKDKLKLGIYTFTHLVFWGSGITLLAMQRSWEPIALIFGLILLRALLQYAILRNTKKKLEGVGKVLWTMFFDFMYLIYFWTIGTKGYLSKTVKWK